MGRWRKTTPARGSNGATVTDRDGLPQGEVLVYMKGKKLLEPHKDIYERVIGQVYDLLQGGQEYRARVFSKRYSTNTRTFTLRVCWDRYPGVIRTQESITFYQDGIFRTSQIDVYPRNRIQPGWKKITEMTDAQLRDEVATILGLPWMSQSVLRHNVTTLRSTISEMLSIADTDDPEIDMINNLVNRYAERKHFG